MRELKIVLMFLMFVFMQASLTSCSNDKDEPDDPSKGESTYTVSVNFELAQIIGASNVQAVTDLTFFEYNDKDELINYQDWYNVTDGSVKKFSANNLAKKITVLMVITAKNGSTTATLKRYSAQIYYLKQGENVNINLDGTLRVSSYNPI